MDYSRGGGGCSHGCLARRDACAASYAYGRKVYICVYVHHRSAVSMVFNINEALSLAIHHRFSFANLVNSNHRVFESKQAKRNQKQIKR